MEKNMDNEKYIVAKFGGWSLADGTRTSAALNYVQANPDIHYVVPSAPGEIKSGDRKVTDFLIDIVKAREAKISYQDVLRSINNRFAQIADFTGHRNMEKMMVSLEEGIASGKSDAWVISRGEAINGRMWADLLDYRFIDPTEIIRFRKDGRLDERSYQVIQRQLRGKDRFVIPGFYGLGADGQVQTFPRDGSDVTGAVVARGVNALMYQNLTSAEGVLSADPRVVSNPRLIETLTFEEYRELGNGGTKVLHRDTIVPVAGVGIPINVRHSLMPESRGTMVASQRSNIDGTGIIGVAGRAGFASLNIHKFGMNEERGIADKILKTLLKSGVSIDHAPSENDRLSVIFNQDQLNGHADEILETIRKSIRSRNVELQTNIGLVSVVGQGIRENRGRVSRILFAALDDASIPYAGTTNALSGISIITFVDGDKVNDAIRVAHDALIR